MTLNQLPKQTYQTHKARARFNARQQRLATLATAKKARFERANAAKMIKQANQDNQQAKRDYIQQALLRKRQRSINKE